MNVLVLNLSGNVGKTTISANLLAPRLGAKLYSIESVNQDSESDHVEAERLRAERFQTLHEQLLMQDQAVVDVGASNVETFLEMLARFRGSVNDYDCVVVPTVKDRKQTTDTINTIDVLLELGVHPAHIKIVFNRVEERDDLEEVFAPLIGYAGARDVPVNLEAVLHLNEVFEQIKDYDMSLAEVIADTTDHRKALRDEKTEEGKTTRIRRLNIKRLSASCAEDMDRAFAAMFPELVLAAD